MLAATARQQHEGKLGVVWEGAPCSSGKQGGSHVKLNRWDRPALVGDPVQPLSADIIRTFGGTAEGFTARQLSAKILRNVDLVLTMTSGHRGEVLQLDASLLKRTFTIREFARMLDVLEEREGQAPQGAGLNGERLAANTKLWRKLPARAASVRHLALAPDTADNDVVDPYRRSADYYRQMEDELAPAIISVLRFARLNVPS